MKLIVLILSFALCTSLGTAQNYDSLNLNFSGCWTMIEKITSTGEFQRHGTYHIRIDSLNNLWQKSGDSEVKKSSIAINGRRASFSWPYREMYQFVYHSDSSFTLTRTVTDTIPPEEYEQMPYPRGPRSSSFTESYQFTRRDCEK